MLAHRRRRWANIKTALAQYLLFHRYISYVGVDPAQKIMYIIFIYNIIINIIFIILKF